MFRNYWDIWIPADILVVEEHDETTGAPAMEAKELDTMLAWLDGGGRPRDPVVLNHMIYHLAAFTSGDDTRRLLRVFNSLPQRNQNWWILQTVRDPAALPLLEYWSTLPAPKDEQDMLEHTIANLQRRTPGRGPTSPPVCCEATEECLLERVRNSATADAAAAAATAAASSPQGPIHSEEEARAWLGGGEPAGEQFQIRYTDELKRSAIVRRDDGAEEKWQYLYDCWRKTEPPANAVAH